MSQPTVVNFCRVSYNIMNWLIKIYRNSNSQFTWRWRARCLRAGLVTALQRVMWIQTLVGRRHAY